MNPSLSAIRQQALKWTALLAGVLFVLLALYAAAGFLLAPWLIQRHVLSMLEERVERQVTVGEVRINPFLLTLEARDVAVEGDMGQSPVIRMQRLFVDLELRGLLARTWTVGHIEVTGMQVHAVLQADGSLNLTDLAAGLASEPGSPVTEAPRWVIHRLAVPNALVRFTDLTGNEPADVVLEPVTLRAAQLSTLQGRPGSFELTATLPLGGTIRSTGELSWTASPSVAGQLEVRALDAAAVWPLLRDEMPLAFLHATADLTARYAYEKAKSLTLQDIQLQVRDLQLGRRGESNPLLQVELAALHGGRVELAGRRVTLESLNFANGSLSVSLDPEGTVNWATVLSAGAEQPGKPSPSERGWTVVIERTKLQQIALSYADASYPSALQISAGSVALEAQLSVSTKAQTQVAVRGLDAQLTQVSLGIPGAEQPLLTVDEASINEGHVDLGRKRIGATRMAVKGGGTDINAGAGGEAGLLKWLDTPQRKAEAAASPGWQYTLDEARVDGFSVQFRDHRFEPPLAFGGVLHAGVHDLSSGRPMAFQAKLAINAGGAVEASGKAHTEAGEAQAQVTLTELPLELIQPLVQRLTNLSVQSGRLSASAEVHFGRGQGRSLQGNGTLKVSDLMINEAGSGDRLLSWKQLDAKDMAFDLEAQTLSIGAVTVEQPGAKLAIAQDGSVNLMQVVRRSDANLASQTEGSRQPQAQRAAPLDFKVDRLELRRGELDFADLSLVLPFSTRIQGINGTIIGISSDLNRRAEVQAEGGIPPYGSASVEGSLIPFDPARMTDLQVRFSNVMMPPLSPYLATFAGRKVKTGKLWLDLRYQVDNARLMGSNDIRLSDFTLGERVKAPGAFDVPLELVVALLQGPDGEIRLSVPVRGDLDSPRFSVVTAVRQAMGNVLERMVTAPFRALEDLLGPGSQQLGAVAFDAGSAELKPEQREKLDALVGAMHERPKLRLVVDAPYDPQSDTKALRRELARRSVAAALGQELEPDHLPGPLSYDDPATRQALRDLLAAQAGTQAPTDLVDPFRSAQNDRALYRAMFDKLAQVQPLPEAALRVLAIERSRAIAGHLVRQGVEPDRVVTGRITTILANSEGVISSRLKIATGRDSG